MMKLSALLMALWGTSLATAAKWMTLPTTINPHERIKFGWCRKVNQSHTCSEIEMDHARCYDFEILDDYLNDNIETVTIRNGRCVIWEKNECHGDHTGMIVGDNVIVENLCPRYPWHRKSSSVKCCAGDHNAHWCADPGKLPKCTGRKRR